MKQTEIPLRTHQKMTRRAIGKNQRSVGVKRVRGKVAHAERGNGRGRLRLRKIMQAKLMMKKWKRDLRRNLEQRGVVDEAAEAEQMRLFFQFSPWL